MARMCSMTGRRPTSGNLVSHSQHKTKRRVKPNVHTKRVLNPATGRMVKATLSTNALRTLSKWQRDGVRYDVHALIGK